MTLSKTAGMIAMAAALLATPAMAQTLSIGPDGVRVMENNPRLERDEIRRDDRRNDLRREDARRGGVSEREAVRIARGEGLRELDDVRVMRNSYRVVGLDRRGDDIRVDIDRRSGAVLGVR
nr:hypothetical protein [Aureimonas sp. Leaf460]